MDAYQARSKSSLCNAVTPALKKIKWFSPKFSKGKIAKIVHGVQAMSVAAASLGKERWRMRVQPYCFTKSYAGAQQGLTQNQDTV